MPAEKCRRLDKERPPSRPRQHLAERRQQDTIGRPQARTADLTPQHLQLMPQHEYLDLLRPLRTTKENEKLEQTADHPIREGQALKQQTPSTHLSTLSRARHTDLLTRFHQAAGAAEAGARVYGTYTHRSLSLRPPDESTSASARAPAGRIRKHELLGGLINEYEAAA